MNIRTIITILFLSFSGPLLAAVIVDPIPAKNTKLFKRTVMPLSVIEKMTGQKFSVIQKLKLIVLQRKMKALRTDQLTSKQKKQANWSMALGIASILLLLTPIGVVAIPAAIIGLILGIFSLKGNSNTKGIVGVVTSSVTLLLFVIAIIIIAFFFSLGGFG